MSIENETRYCKTCQKPFQVPINSPKKFCSNSCSARRPRKSRKIRTYEDRLCKFCGKAFTVETKSMRKFCSRPCAARSAAQKPKKPAVELLCVVCQKPFLVDPRSSRTCCSAECSRKKRSSSLSERYATDEAFRARMIEAQQNRRPWTNEQKAKLSAYMKKKWEDPEYREKCLPNLEKSRVKGVRRTEETKARMSEALKKRWRDPEYRARRSGIPRILRQYREATSTLVQELPQNASDEI